MEKLDNIENSYKERFDAAAIHDEGWNDPSDLVWERIEGKLYVEDKRRFGYLPFLLLSLLIMSLVFTAYLFYQNQKLKKEIQRAITSNIDTSLELYELDEQNSYQEGADENTFVEEKKEINFNEESAVSETNSTSNLSAELNKKKTTSSDQNRLTEINRTQRNILEVVKSDLLTIDKEVVKRVEKSLLIADENIEERNINVSYLPGLIQLLELGERDLSAKEILVKKDEKIRGAYFSILPNASVGFLKTTGNQEAALTELIDKEYANMGYGIDFVVTSPLSDRLDISYGLGVETMNFSTEYDITLPYNTEDETIRGESGYIDFEHSLPTAFGNTETALRLSRLRASDVLQEPNVILDFDTQHRFVSMSLPIGLSYRMGSEKSFFRVGANLRPSYIIDAQSNIQYVKSHHSDIDAVNNVSVSTYTDIRRFNASFGLDIGYHLHVFERSGIDINVGFQDYLFDMYEVNSFSSSVQKLGLSVGYFYYL